MLETLQNELKSAMKSEEKALIKGLRNIIGKLKAAQIDKGDVLTNDESLKILHSASKQLRESIHQYEKGGRQDLVEEEKFELSIVEQYLPEQMSEGKIRESVKNIIQTTGAESMDDMGKVMGLVMKKLSGQADGKIVQKLVVEELNK
tara:strand:+ start:800 stop:1240 length:441 start_codon:yes stop_codon:yes gene_type:complete